MLEYRQKTRLSHRTRNARVSQSARINQTEEQR